MTILHYENNPKEWNTHEKIGVMKTTNFGHMSILYRKTTLSAKNYNQFGINGNQHEELLKMLFKNWSPKKWNAFDLGKDSGDINLIMYNLIDINS